MCLCGAGFPEVHDARALVMSPLPFIDKHAPPTHFFTFSSCFSAASISVQVPSCQDDQFDAFVAVFDRFLLPASPEEINISSAMRKAIAEFRTR